MRILYGVQGTGNGHISRARMMAKHFAKQGADVQFLFSGRPADRYFDMEPFGDYMLRTGLTFVTHRGAISHPRTLLQNKPLKFIREVRELNVDDYDVIMTDFEPTTAWAGKLRGKRVVGFGHQYAFKHPGVPNQGVTFINSLIMRHFAPVNVGLGLHWDAFGGPVLPPIINPAISEASGEQVTVYLPFESQEEVTAVLRQLPHIQFVQYSPDLNDGISGNVRLCKTNLHGFKKDLQQSRAVVCNAGFELISECLYMGLPVLAKPVAGQGEQLANVAALKQLGLAKSFDSLAAGTIDDWFQQLQRPPAQRYPDVAEAVVQWLLNGSKESVESLSQRLWQPSETLNSSAA